ncbi:Domain of unknown function DUF2520 [Ammonifex degensii KC4]|uniref:DUF2520 domain-containing protein n=1 Tax=Ammonifex degensii (strain DSM 10501 / KC4) TaxID=429009 RepID=C9R9I0_AMMDK|nr:Rossmann-like and DUF2520 domain-containing protein [Ammonifex degensii]ACX52959.1 Domain of unknown function DUF2520 [Ammonifex degensii KC4]
MQRPAVAIVGAGRVGTALAVGLKAQGYEIVAVASRSLSSARYLAGRVGAAVLDPVEAAKRGELVFLTTPDDAIAEVAAVIAREGGFRTGQWVAHASGSLPAEVLRPAAEVGAIIFSLHPLQSFADRETAAELLAGSFFVFEGDERAEELARTLVADLRGSFWLLRSADKPLYHAAACAASNYLVSLLHFMKRLAVRAGLPEEQIMPAFLPLIQGTLRNVLALGTVGALTGPVARGDQETIRRHKSALNPEEWEIYRVLGLYTLKIARDRGLAEEKVQALEEIFEGGKNA